MNVNGVLTVILFQIARAKGKVAGAEDTGKSETKDMMYPLLNGFSNGAALGDVRQRVAGAVASQ